VDGGTAEPMKFGIGQPVRRFEDIRLITGRGRYQDDIVLPRQTYAMFLRSPHAHARIVSIDVNRRSHRRRLQGRRLEHAEGGHAAKKG
jgi:xanthine dehydrogenase molybdopterin-binding subunit B